MIDTSNYNKIRKIIYDILTKEKVFQGEWHYGTVESIVAGNMLSVFVDGSNTSQKIPCNPKVKFNIGDEVFVQFINKDSKNKFVSGKRGVNAEVNTVITTSTTEPSNPLTGEFWFKVISPTNIQMTQRNADNTAWSNINPFTKTSDISDSNGVPLDTYLSKLGDIVSFPLNSQVYASKGVSQTISSGVYTKVGLQNENVDIQNEFANTTFTPKTSGDYLVITYSNWGDTPPTGDIYHDIWSNGSQLIHTGVGFNNKVCSYTRIVHMTANTNYEFYVQAYNSSNPCTLVAAQLFIYKLG